MPYLYAANAPLQVDQPVEAWWRGPGDLARLEKAAEEGAGRYTVVSRPPQPTVDALRAAPPDLPPDLAERYLSLPESVPELVPELVPGHLLWRSRQAGQGFRSLPSVSNCAQVVPLR